MIASCTHCGKRYRISPDQFNGDTIRFKCRACGTMVSVDRLNPREKNQTPEVGGGLQLDLPPPQPVRFGLRLKMTLLFFLIPIGLMVAAGVMYINQVDKLAALIAQESGGIVNDLGERLILEKSRSVAAQVQLWLAANPLGKNRFDSTPAFKDIAVQKVGTTGYTALYQVPGSDGVWRTWAHVNPKIIGIDMTALKKPLGKNFNGFWAIFSGARQDQEARGYYTWQDKDGRFREKFMACTPVMGTPYIIAATTYMDEFTQDLEKLSQRTAAVTRRIRLIISVIFGATLVLIGAIVAVYGHRLTARLRHLSTVADRISVGDLAAEIKIRSRDEMGALAGSIQRMQDSLTVLMRRRSRKN